MGKKISIIKQICHILTKRGFRFWEFGGILAPALGDVRELENGNVFITDSFNQRAIEVDPETDEIVWEVKTNFIPYRVWIEGTW